MRILLTCPHAYCGNNSIDRNYFESEHFCDLIAEDMTNELYTKLSKNNQVDIEIGKTARPECDLNRIQCRNTSFRRKISQKMQNFDLILDIHSYPSNSEYGAYQAVILEDRPLSRDLSSYSLYQYLISNGINVGLLQGRGNDIEDESHEKGIDSFLIEFDEDMSLKFNQNLINLISEWVRNLTI